MARRKSAIDVEITEGAMRIRHAGRCLTIVVGGAPLEAQEQADFVIQLDDIEYWDAPDNETEIGVDELQFILAAIEEECERHGLSVEFD